MRILQIAGPSNSGKTRLLEALLEVLPAVRILKWSHHSIPDDSAETDTGRLGSHGRPSLLAHPDGLIWREPLPRSDVYALLESSLESDALVVVEGDKWAPHPKIWLGADLPPAGLPVGLVIGPNPPPDPAVPWRRAAVPLDDSAIEELKDYLRDTWQVYAVPYGRIAP